MTRDNSETITCSLPNFTPSLLLRSYLCYQLRARFLLIGSCWLNVFRYAVLSINSTSLFIFFFFTHPNSSTLLPLLRLIIAYTLRLRYFCIRALPNARFARFPREKILNIKFQVRTNVWISHLTVFSLKVRHRIIWFFRRKIIRKFPR